MKGGSSIAFFSSSSSSRNFATFRFPPVSRSISTATPPLLHRPSLRISIPSNNRKQLYTPLRRRTATIATSSTMAASFSPEKARVPPAIQSPSPPISKFKIGLCQLSVTSDKERNIAHARTVIEEAAEKGAKLILLL